MYSIMLKGAAESYYLTFFPAKFTDSKITAQLNLLHVLRFYLENH